MSCPVPRDWSAIFAPPEIETESHMHLIWSPKQTNTQSYSTISNQSLQLSQRQSNYTLCNQSLQPSQSQTFGCVLSGWSQWYLYLFEILDPAQQFRLRRGQLLQTARKISRSPSSILASPNSRAKRIPWCARPTARAPTISADEEQDVNAVLKSDPRIGQSRGN
jgi:hypothetical protein